MEFLSDQTLERRARRRLAKFGLKVKKHRGQQGGYTVYNDPDAKGNLFGFEETWYTNIYKLLDLTEYLHERYCD